MPVRNKILGKNKWLQRVVCGGHVSHGAWPSRAVRWKGDTREEVLHSQPEYLEKEPSGKALLVLW